MVHWRAPSRGDDEAPGQARQLPSSSGNNEMVVGNDVGLKFIPVG